MDEGLLHIIIDKSPQNNPKTWTLNTDGVPQIFHFIIDNLNKGIKITDERGLGKKIGDFMPSAMFILVPFMGLLLLFVYKKKKLFYSYHLITVLHFHCFVFFSNSIRELIPFIGDIITIPLYFYKGLTISSIQYLIFSILAILGYISWKKILSNSTQT